MEILNMLVQRSFKLPKEIMDSLKEQSVKNHLKVSQIVRMAVIEKVKQLEGEKPLLENRVEKS